MNTTKFFNPRKESNQALIIESERRPLSVMSKIPTRTELVQEYNRLRFLIQIAEDRGLQGDAFYSAARYSDFLKEEIKELPFNR